MTLVDLLLSAIGLQRASRVPLPDYVVEAVQAATARLRAINARS